MLREKGKADLKAAFEELGNKQGNIISVVERMEKAATAIDLTDEKRVRRLSDAIRRLASDLDFLASKWGQDAK